MHNSFYNFNRGQCVTDSVTVTHPMEFILHGL